jgi:hypothetical protein
LLSAKKGSHRFTWDMHYAPLELPVSYPIAATYKNTAPDPTSPWVMPGIYTVSLSIRSNNKQEQYRETVEIKMDPRVKLSVADLQKQHDLSLQCYKSRMQCMALQQEVHR